MKKLHVSRRLSLPIDLVTQRTSILGKTRSGKSHTAGVVVEEVLKARQQTVILDPKGDWWGLRSSADGKAAGLPITIMGGKHGDIPLEPTAGALIADVVVNEGISVVLDLSLFESKADEVRFATAFLDRLYRKNVSPILLVIDEADTFAPQHPERNETVMLNRMETICRRGAGRGIGVILISQRSASIHKGCLSQTELMIAHQTTAPQDKKAIELWVVNHGDEERRDLFMRRIPKLPIGTAIIWSPSWLDIYEEVGIRSKETYDSSAAPRVGRRRRPPKVLAQVDLERLKKHMAETIEKAKNEDPKLLHTEIARLKAELSAAKRTPSAPKSAPAPAPKTIVQTRTETKVVEVPAVTGAEVKRVNRILIRMERLAHRLGPISDLQGALWSETKRLGGELSDAVEAAENLRKAPPKPPPIPAPRVPVKAPVPPKVRDAAPAPEEEAQNGDFSKPQRKLLAAVVEMESIGVSPVPKEWLALWLGIRVSGSMKNNLGSLRSRGCIDYAPGIVITDKGRAEAADVETFEDPSRILRRVLDAVSGPEGEIVKLLHGRHPEWMTKEEIAAALGLQVSGSLKNNLGHLHTGGVLEYGTAAEHRGGIKCSDWLFAGEAAVR